MKSVIYTNTMGISVRKNAFIELGKLLKIFSLNLNPTPLNTDNQQVFYTDFKQAIQLSQQENKWFTDDNLKFCFARWADLLTETELQNWINNSSFEYTSPKNVLIVMAGNIPMVGFHDLLSVVISGHNALVKCSSNDRHLLPAIKQFLTHINPDFNHCISFVKDRVTDFDAVIATGSNNTARYFEYYFQKKPHIIRKNRNSVAVLTGNESYEDLVALGQDIFQYFGLGCRSVSKIFVPENYDFTLFFKAMYTYRDIIQHKKYENNYDYNKAVYLMSLFPIQENGFLLLKEDTHSASPIATLFYEFYTDISEVKKTITENRSQYQCVVSKYIFADEIPFGKTQYPGLSDYADNVNTLDFLSRLK